jgi:beta-glucosidase
VGCRGGKSPSLQTHENFDFFRLISVSENLKAAEGQLAMKHGEIIKNLTLSQKAALLKGENVWQTRAINEIPSAFLADGPHGLRKQAGSADNLGLNPSLPATCFPTASALANSWDENLMEEIGAALGEEAAHLGVNIILGPGLNIKRSPLCGRNFEYYSEDPILSGKMAAAMIRGIQSQGVSACPKHFAANSQELLRMSNDSVLDERTLREIYLTGFEIAVKEGKPKSIMSAYNKINGEYAHESRHLLIDILRGEWGFDGAVISDWGGVNDVVASIKNGGTLEMPGGGTDSARQIVAAVENGELSEQDLDARVDEIIELVLNTQIDADADVDVEAHHALARKAAEKSVVLLKNEEKILPLKKGEKIAVIGEFARTPRFQGAGSSQVNAIQVDAALDALRETELDIVGFAPGYKLGGAGDSSLIDEALELAAKAYIILLFIGLDNISESEGIDRETLSLPENQLRLLNRLAQTGKKIAVVLTAGSVIDMSWADGVSAVLHGFLHGEAGAGAIVRALTGEVNPSGKLAETYPVKLEDTPTYGDYPEEKPLVLYREGLDVGYRHYARRNIPVAYPFGFGLSYTSFEYSDLSVSSSGVTFTIKNSGDFDGCEITQLYVNGELKGFKRVFIKKGDSVTVNIPFDEYTFRHFSLKTGGWRIVRGEYEVSIGRDAQDIRLSDKISFEGEIDEPEPDFEFPEQQEWLTDGKFAKNNTFGQLKYSKSVSARLVEKVLARMIAGSFKKNKPDLNLVFIYNLPFRGLARQAGEVFSEEMADGIVKIANGHFFRGAAQVIGGFFRNRKANKVYKI